MRRKIDYGWLISYGLKSHCRHRFKPVSD